MKNEDDEEIDEDDEDGGRRHRRQRGGNRHKRNGFKEKHQRHHQPHVKENGENGQAGCSTNKRWHTILKSSTDACAPQPKFNDFNFIVKFCQLLNGRHLSSQYLWFMWPNCNTTYYNNNQHSNQNCKRINDAQINFLRTLYRFQSLRITEQILSIKRFQSPTFERKFKRKTIYLENLFIQPKPLF